MLHVLYPVSLHFVGGGIHKDIFWASVIGIQESSKSLLFGRIDVDFEYSTKETVGYLVMRLVVSMKEG
jgi:hypothetical protein